MRVLAIASIFAMTVSGAAVAQEGQAAPHQDTAAPPPTHEMCKAVMGKAMNPKSPHDHGRDKTGAPTWPNGKALTAAEMEQMHKACAEKMASKK
ncbi:hypothetical protein [Caulobacter sp. 1776]|uniref:hypothetical protein n=1 Tax=Caulobacter sp. 1776 TaxID=3156420 RepID=UPI003397DD42